MKTQRMQEDPEAAMQAARLTETTPNKRGKTRNNNSSSRTSPRLRGTMRGVSASRMTAAVRDNNVGSHDDDDKGTKNIAQSETRLVHILRLCVGMILAAIF